MEYKKITTLLVVVTVLIVCTVLFTGYVIARAFSGPSIDENELYLVTDVKDGDTFDVKIGRHTETVRMLGIDTPETVDPRKQVQCYGKEASNETKQLLTGQSVRLKLNPNREEKDRYGRFLAYVYLGDKFVNQFLLENGFAREYMFGTPYMYQREFKEAEKQAQGAKKGLWSSCPVVESQKSRSL